MTYLWGSSCCDSGLAGHRSRPLAGPVGPAIQRREAASEPRSKTVDQSNTQTHNTNQSETLIQAFTPLIRCKKTHTTGNIMNNNTNNG